MKKYSGFIKRLIAYIIDSIIFIIIDLMIPGTTSFKSIFSIIIWTAYFVWMTGTYGATIGKMILKLKITKEDGSKINYSDALVRELASYLSFIVLGLGYLNIIWDKRKQSWHDKIAKTVVIES